MPKKNSNKKPTLLIRTVLIAVVLLSTCFFLFKRSTVLDNKFCRGVSETECFSRLSGCMTAFSTRNFLEKKGLEYSSSDGGPHEIDAPLQTNFPNAKIFSYHLLLGGGDYGSFSFIKLGKEYCDLNEENAKMIFSEVKTEEDALTYYTFLKNDLGSAWQQDLIYIMKIEDYDNHTVKDFASDCKEDYKEKLLSRVTEVEEVENGFIITFIAFSRIGKIEFTEIKARVTSDGIIKNISNKVLLDCGMGLVY